MKFGIWIAQVQKFRNTLTNFFFSLSFQLCHWQQNKEKKEDSCYFTTIFNRKGSNYSPVMQSQSFLIHLQSTLDSTKGNVVKIARNASLFGATESTPDPNFEVVQRKILLSAFSYLKDPDPYITWEMHQPPYGAPPIIDLLTIDKSDNNNLLPRMISFTQSNSTNPRATVSVSSLLDFTRTSDSMPPSVFTVDDIDFRKTVFFKPISHIFSARLSIRIQNKQYLIMQFGDTTFDAMHSVIPFQYHSTAPFAPPKRTHSCFSNIALPLCCPLPIHHTIML